MSRIRPGKFARLVKAGRVPERKISQQEGECPHVDSGKCEACATGARPYLREQQMTLPPKLVVEFGQGVSQ